jgi:D-threo-aldose 1-dehydrogenase
MGRITDEQSDTTLSSAWNAGIRFYDTAPWYGRTQGEHRLGRVLRRQSPEDVLLSTKVGRIFRAPADPVRHAAERRAAGRPGGLNFAHHYDYSYDGVMRSYEDSLQRLGMTRIDMLVIHDLDSGHLRNDETVTAHLHLLLTGGLRALGDLKSWGCIQAIGAGVNHPGIIPRFIELLDLDFVLVALRYTLGEQTIVESELPLLEKRGIGMIIGGVFNSGLYAVGPVKGARYNYRDPTASELDRVQRIDAACRRHGVSLAAAALQFPMHHPVSVSVIPGAVSADEVHHNIAAMRETIPTELWAELKHEGLLAREAPTP